MNTTKLCRAGLISAIYCVLTIAISPLSFGAIQFRFSEALTVLPLFYPESIIGLTIGCLIANIFGNGVLDIVLGTLGTLISSLLTYFVGKRLKKFPVKLIVGEIFPIVINAVLVPFTFCAFADLKHAYFLGVLTVGLGQLAVISTLGTILAVSINGMLNKKSKF